jgi:hypothetical protein
VSCTRVCQGFRHHILFEHFALILVDSRFANDASMIAIVTGSIVIFDMKKTETIYPTRINNAVPHSLLEHSKRLKETAGHGEMAQWSCCGRGRCYPGIYFGLARSGSCILGIQRLRFKSSSNVSALSQITNWRR